MATSTVRSTRFPEVDRTVTIAQLASRAEIATDVLAQIRDSVLEPYPRKQPPTFTSAQVAALCDVDKQKFAYLQTKLGLPAGTSAGNGRSKRFSLEETQTCIQKTAATTRFQRPSSAPARVLTVANFKGGVAKTTTTVSVAQALTLLGRRVLLIDCDPQGTSTEMLGWSPDTEISEESTLLPLVYGTYAFPNEQGVPGEEVVVSSLEYAVRSTYWSNLDLVPATISLFDAEFEIPAKIATEQNADISNIINRGLDSLRAQYDVIIIDTPPALSYLTINALMAADGILMPCPPEGLDFASSTQFWNLFVDVASHLPGDGREKRYDFVNVVMTKVKSDDISSAVGTWLQKAYGDMVLPIQIPDSVVPKGASAQMSTVYDLSKADGSQAAYQRFKEPMDQLAAYLDGQFVRAWQKMTEA